MTFCIGHLVRVGHENFPPQLSGALVWPHLCGECDGCERRRGLLQPRSNTPITLKQEEEDDITLMDNILDMTMEVIEDELTYA